MTSQLVDRIQSKIESAYLDGGYSLSWSFLSSPLANLNSSKVALLGLNPGGGSIGHYHPSFSCEDGSAYVIESWGGRPAGTSKLQQQVRKLFAALALEPSSVLSGNIVPFRSPNWAALSNRTEALLFGKSIWRELFSHWTPELVVCLGEDSARTVRNILGIQNLERILVGWGNCTLSIGQTETCRVIGLPHLSRFAIIGRSQNEDALAQAFGDLWRREFLLA